MPEIDARDDPDAALVAWLNQEEAMFRRLEKRIVAERVAKGFYDGSNVDVDAFIKYSLGVQNRRKSRMGHSFEHQLKAIFDTYKLKYEAQIITEKGKKPDFIFPGRNEYNDDKFPTKLLTMLAAKSTCKDRWPQVLPEAERIGLKHLVTLEPGISVSQTEMMHASKIQLIVPKSIFSSYTRLQQKWLWGIGDFVYLIATKQENY